MWLLELLANILTQFIFDSLLPRINLICFGKKGLPEKGTAGWYFARTITILLAFVLTGMIGITLVVLLIKVFRLFRN